MPRHGTFYEFERENWTDAQIDVEDLREGNWSALNPKEKTIAQDMVFDAFLREFYGLGKA